jgi:CPA1 family monovalent cation:H+ antiporter
MAQAVRQEFMAHLAQEPEEEVGIDSIRVRHGDIHRRALKAARQAVLAMRDSQEIGDDAFHQIEEELDWLEMADGVKGEGAE